METFNLINGAKRTLTNRQNRNKFVREMRLNSKTKMAAFLTDKKWRFPFYFLFFIFLFFMEQLLRTRGPANKRHLLC